MYIAEHAIILAAGFGSRMVPVTLDRPKPLVRVNGVRIIDAMYDIDTAKAFIKEYLQDTWNHRLEFHYLAFTAIIAYYWFVWAMYRESFGADLRGSRMNWYYMAEQYSSI